MPPPTRIVDALIIGGGPAGLAAALSLARLRFTAIIFDNASYRNEGIKHMHTVPSRDHTDPNEFRGIAREQITSRYRTVLFEKATIRSAVKKNIYEEGGYEGFEVGDGEGKVWRGKKLVIATGSRDMFPDVEGYKDNWPAHIYQCLGCDGYEQADTPIGVLEFTSPMAGHFVSMAIQLSSQVTIFSNGPISSAPAIQSAFNVARACGATVDERKIKRLVNDGEPPTHGITIEFETGPSVTLGFIVHRPECVNHAPELIEQLGLETEDAAKGGVVKVVDMFNQTSVAGCFAAGDTMVLMKQVTVAMAEGVKAGAGVMKQLLEERGVEAVQNKEVN